MDSLFQYMLAGNNFLNKNFGYPTFTWNGNSYPCIASVTTFNRELGEGGFSLGQLITMTVNRYNVSSYLPIFPNDIIPDSQQIINYNGYNYRIESVILDPVFDTNLNGQQTAHGATFKIIGMSTSKGIVK